jgi:hypothetical protein
MATASSMVDVLLEPMLDRRREPSVLLIQSRQLATHE